MTTAKKMLTTFRKETDATPTIRQWYSAGSDCFWVSLDAFDYSKRLKRRVQWAYSKPFKTQPKAQACFKELQKLLA